MSIARKCNKCKSYFDPFEMEGQTCTFINPTFRTSSDIQEHYRGELLDACEGINGIIDRCPKCAMKFKAFMNNKEDDRINDILDFNLKDSHDAMINQAKRFQKNSERFADMLESRKPGSNMLDNLMSGDFDGDAK